MSLQLVAASNQFAEVATNFGGAITDYPLTVVVGAKVTDGTTLGCLTWYGNSGAGNVWVHSLNSDGLLNGFVAQSRNTATDGTAISTTDPAAVEDTWLDLGARHTNATLREVFVNGTEEGQNTVSHASGTENRFSVGHFGDSTPGNPFDGLIAYVAIYSRALTDQEMSDIAGGTDPNTIANLVELWDFTQTENQYVGLVGGVTLVPSNSPTFVADAPNHSWLAVNQSAAQNGSGTMRLDVRTYADFVAATDEFDTDVTHVFYMVASSRVAKAAAFVPQGVVYMDVTPDRPTEAEFTTDFATAVELTDFSVVLPSR